MANVTVEFHGLMMGEDVERTEEYEVPFGTTARAVIDLFLERHIVSFQEKSISDYRGKLWETHVVLLNGIGLSSEKHLTTEVKEGDNISIFLPVSGG